MQPYKFGKLLNVREPFKVREGDTPEVREGDKVRGEDPLKLGKFIPPEAWEGAPLKLGQLR